MATESATQQSSAGWGRRKSWAAVVVALAIGGLGGAALYAATQGSAHPVGGPVHGPLPATPVGPRAAPPQPPGTAGVLHSEYVVSDGHGGYTTKLTQTGIVDETTPSSLVVRSDDGFTQIYAFPSAAAGSTGAVAANDVVTITATREGPSLTLTSISEGPSHEN